MNLCYLQERKIAVNGIEINCLKTGVGPRNVFCLPGSLGDFHGDFLLLGFDVFLDLFVLSCGAGTIWTDFSPQIVGFDLNKFSLLVWDPPGYGKSRPPKRNFSVDYLERDADLAAELMKVRNIPSYRVCFVHP